MTPTVREKACPFCAGTELAQAVVASHLNDATAPVVICVTCGARGPDELDWDYRATEEET
jgi:hypothetical protein